MAVGAQAAVETLPDPGQVLARASHAVSASEGYTCEDVKERSDIIALRDTWLRLEALSEGSVVFQAFDLSLAWLDAYVFCENPTHKAHVLVFRDENDLPVALAPFAQKIAGGIQLAHWIGDPLIQYGDILLDPRCNKPALRNQLCSILGSWDVNGLHLGNVREDARIHDVLDLKTDQIGEGREAGLADFTGFDDVDGYFATFSKRSRKNRRTKRRKLSELGELGHRVVEAGPEGAALCQLALDWKVAWLAERGLSSRAFMDARALSVLKDACGRASASNPITFFVQTLDDTPIAIEIGLRGQEGNAAFMGTYDPQYETYSAGRVQMESTILHGFEEGWGAYDMLAPMSEYKHSWSTRTLGVADYMVPLGPIGLAYRHGYLGLARPLAKRLWEGLPASVRSVLLSKANALPERDQAA